MKGRPGLRRWGRHSHLLRTVLPLGLAALLTLVAPASHAQQPPAPPAPAEFAAYLAELGLHRQAVDELQRLDLQGQPQWHGRALGYGYGVRLLRDGLAAEAAEVLTAVGETDPNPQRAEQHQPLLALALARSGQVARAVAILSRLETFGATAEQRGQALAIRCMVHLSAAQADQGAPCARQLLGPAADPAALADLQTDAESSAFWHGAASALLPGLGQSLGGHWADAGAAVLVNGGLIYSTWSLVADALYVDATLLGLGLTVRYYVGNIEHGAAAGRQAALRRRQRGARRLADLLAAVRSGPVEAEDSRPR